MQFVGWLKSCCRSAAHRRDASVGATRGAGTIAGGAPASAGSARRRSPRGRFAYPPSYRVVTWSRAPCPNKFHVYDKRTGKLLRATTLPAAGNATRSLYIVMDESTL